MVNIVCLGPLQASVELVGLIISVHNLMEAVVFAFLTHRPMPLCSGIVWNHNRYYYWWWILS